MGPISISKIRHVWIVMGIARKEAPSVGYEFRAAISLGSLLSSGNGDIAHTSKNTNRN